MSFKRVWLPITLTIITNFISVNGETYQCSIPTEPPKGARKSYSDYRHFQDWQSYKANNASFDPMSSDFLGNSVVIEDWISKINTDGLITHNSNYIAQMGLYHLGIRILEEGAFNGLHCLLQLDLSGNHLEKIRSNVFNESMPHLLQLNLADNEIQEINNDYFHLKSLEVLNLNNNHISSLTDDAFERTPALKELYMGENFLTHIRFDQTLPSSLMTLYVSFNNLSEVKFDVRFKFQHLTRLGIEGNKLIDLDMESLRAVAPRLALLYIQGNPWYCPVLMKMLNVMDEHYIFHKSKNRTQFHIEGIDCITDQQIGAYMTNNSNWKPRSFDINLESKDNVLSRIADQNDKMIDEVAVTHLILVCFLSIFLVYIVLLATCKVPFVARRVAVLWQKAEDSVVAMNNGNGTGEVISLVVANMEDERES